MSLQIAATSLSNVGNPALQAYQNYYYAPVNPKLDPITEQILNTQDAALKVMQQIESGATARFWEAQKKLPSATWLGDLMDWFLGWGKYNERSVGSVTKREVLAKEQYSVDICGQTDRRFFLDYVNGDISTSFETHNNSNNSCSLIQPVPYQISVSQWIYRNISGPNDIACRIRNCFKDRMACLPFCWPCVNATDAQKNNFSDDIWDEYTFDWNLDNRITWDFFVVGKTKLNLWKIDIIFQLLNSTLTECEKGLFTPEQSSSNSKGYYALLIIPAVIGGGAGVAVWLHNKRNKNMRYGSLESGEANL